VADAARITRRLQALWEIAHGPGGGADRPAFSPAEADAMLLVAGWARELGLTPGIDPHGNLWALPENSAAALVTSGSHVDTVPDGGRYDGALGTVLGLELVADLAGADTTAAAGLLVCAAEEAPRFGAGTIGSRLLTGALPPDALRTLHDADGTTAADARAGYLDALSQLPQQEPPLDRWRAHAEVHVALRHELTRLGIVTRVASPRRFQITVTGESGHAGEIAMADRRDALAAAAEIVLAIEHAATAEPPETVATVGTLSVAPGAISVIPGAVGVGVDLRAIDAGSLDRLEGAVRAATARIAARRSVEADTALTRAGAPVELDPKLVRAAVEQAAQLGLPATTTWSGAGHDAQHVNALAPALLVFTPLHGGQSHTPQEGAEIGEIMQAAELVAAVLREVAA
jgi:hydantoinase/carbamoylase family amidase